MGTRLRGGRAGGSGGDFLKDSHLFARLNTTAFFATQSPAIASGWSSREGGRRRETTMGVVARLAAAEAIPRAASIERLSL